MAVGEMDMTHEEAMQAFQDAHDQAKQMLIGQGAQFADMHLASLSDNGVAPLARQMMQGAGKSKVEQGMSDDGDSEDDLPVMPGMTYFNHLFRRAKNKRAKKDEGRPKDDLNIYTDHLEALKTAMQAIGLYSDRNPGGMPIDPKTAKKLWFGDEKIDGIQEAEWRSGLDKGDTAIDPKKIRKFVNYDGSMTWEILNDDKTVMSRFTMGEYRGTKVFAQGGYSKFADVLKKVQGKDPSAGFGSALQSLGGG